MGSVGLSVAYGNVHDVEGLIQDWSTARVEVRLPQAAGLPSTMVRSRQELGGRIDRTRLERRGAANLQVQRALALPVELDADAARAWLSAVKSDYDRAPVNARLDPETGSVSDGADGILVDVWATLDRLDVALAAGDEQIEVVIHRTSPRVTREDLQGVDASAVLGYFETPYDGSGRSAERTHNLRVAASKIDGMVLMPSETFDFNAVVGDRSLAGGFRPAPVIAGGELVDGVGGGACQIAGSLHAAAFFAGLRIVERSPHSRPSSYIKMGLDAAVSYPNLNFRFENTTDRPIQIRVIVAGGKVRAELRGAERTGDVSFMRRVDDFAAFDERTVNDSSLPAGVRVLKQRGVPGFTITRWRVFEDPTGRALRRQAFEDQYPPTTQVWRVGTGGRTPDGYEPPPGDTHGEYRADEFTIMTQRADEIETTRRAGRTGAPGWTTRANMPGVD